jgi:hypothetical protein
VVALLARLRRQPLEVQALVDLVSAGGAAVELAPDRLEVAVIVATALGAGAVSRSERRRLVEEEQLRVAARLQERPAAPAKLEPAADPALAGERAADGAVGVVEAAAVAVDEAARRIGDELPQRRDAVPAGRYARSGSGSMKSRIVPTSSW